MLEKDKEKISTLCDKDRYDLYLYTDGSYKYFPHGEFCHYNAVVWCLTNVYKY